jgi:hypothetical protein
MTTAEKLARIAKRGTLYELAISKGTTSYLICYSPMSRSMLMKALRKQPHELIALTGSETFDLAKRAADGATMGEWKIRWTGRTHRQSIIEGELPRVPSIAKVTS